MTKDGYAQRVSELTALIESTVDDILIDLAETENARQALADRERRADELAHADLVACREQLRQESERADREAAEASSLRDEVDRLTRQLARAESELRPNSALRQQANTYFRVLRHPAIHPHTGREGRSNSDQIIDRIDELAAGCDAAKSVVQHLMADPDLDDLDHAVFVQNWLARIAPSDLLLPGFTLSAVCRAVREYTDRLEAAQREKDATEKLIDRASQVMSDAADHPRGAAMSTCRCCGRPHPDTGPMHFTCWEEHHSDPTGSWPPEHVCHSPRSPRCKP